MNFHSNDKNPFRTTISTTVTLLYKNQPDTAY